MIRIAICDGDQNTVTSIESWIIDVQNKIHFMGDIDVFSDTVELEAAIKDGERFNLISLDIDRNVKFNIDRINYLKEKISGVLWIFMSINKNRIFCALEVGAFDFLVKPINYERIESINKN